MANDGNDYAAQMKAAQKKGDKSAYFTAQRKRAEKLSDQGDRKASVQAHNIYAKMGDKGSDQSEKYLNRAGLGKGVGDVVTGIGKGVRAAADAVAGGTIGKGLGALKGAARMIPEASAMARQGGSRAGSALARKAVGDSKSAVPNFRRTGKPAAARTVNRSAQLGRVTEAARRQTSKLGNTGNPKVPRPASGSAPKALPAPKGPAPKMQHGKVRAGSSRSKQTTPRNNGTNPRAKKAAQKKAA